MLSAQRCKGQHTFTFTFIDSFTRVTFVPQHGTPCFLFSHCKEFWSWVCLRYERQKITHGRSIWIQRIQPQSKKKSSKIELYILLETHRTHEPNKRFGNGVKYAVCYHLSLAGKRYVSAQKSSLNNKIEVLRVLIRSLGCSGSVCWSRSSAWTVSVGSGGRLSDECNDTDIVWLSLVQTSMWEFKVSTGRSRVAILDVILNNIFSISEEEQKKGENTLFSLTGRAKEALDPCDHREDFDDRLK